VGLVVRGLMLTWLTPLEIERKWLVRGLLLTW